MANEEGKCLLENFRNSNAAIATAATKSRCKDILSTVFVLPLTAGISNDGMISSNVFLSTCFALIITLLFLPSSSNMSEYQAVAAKLMLAIFLLVGFVIYIILLLGKCGSKMFESTNEKIFVMIKIRIAFVTLFSIISIFVFVLKIVVHLECNQFYQGYENVLHIVEHIFIMIFNFLQVLFLIFCCCHKAKSSCYANFVGKVLIMANASVYLYTSFRFPYDQNLLQNISEGCQNTTFTFSLYMKSNAYVQPAIVANALLSIMLINQIFSRYIKAEEHNITNESRPGSDSFKSILMIILGVIICSPLFALRVMQHIHHDVDMILATFDLVIKLLMYVALLRSLYRVNLLEQRNKHPDILNITNVLLFISSFGSLLYFSLQVISSFSVSCMFTIKSLTNIVVTYVQTVLIFQMNNYDKIEFTGNLFSISNLFLFMAFVNCGLWVYDCFFNTLFAEIEDYSSKFYGSEKWQMINHVLDPIVIFYRFNCFIFFLDNSTFLTRNKNGGSPGETILGSIQCTDL